MTQITETLIRRLSQAQRDELVAHAGDAQPFVVAQRADNGRLSTIRKLMELRLLEGDQTVKPRYTRLTTAGREAAAFILGEYADALVAAGCLSPDLRPIDLVERIKNAPKVELPPRPARDYDRHRNR